MQGSRRSLSINHRVYKGSAEGLHRVSFRKLSRKLLLMLQVFGSVSGLLLRTRCIAVQLPDVTKTNDSVAFHLLNPISPKPYLIQAPSVYGHSRKRKCLLRTLRQCLGHLTPFGVLGILDLNRTAQQSAAKTSGGFPKLGVPCWGSP